MDGAVIPVCAPYVQGRGLLNLDDLGVPNECPGCAAVGADQSPFTELCTSEVPNHHDDYIPQSCTVDVVEDGQSGCAAGLPIVRHTKTGVARTESPGEAVMPSVGVLATHAAHKIHRLLSRAHRSSARDEPRALDGIHLEVSLCGEC